MNYSVSIVIPNYNGEEILRKNLPKVFEAASLYKDVKIETIIVDDASTDASMSVISRLRQDFGVQANLRLIRNEKNLGFSSTVNKGVKESMGEIVVLLNTDIRPEKDFLEPLIKHFSDPFIFAVGCMDKSIENGKTILRGRGIGSWKRGFFVHSRGEVNQTNTLWVSGGSGAFRKSIWDKLGGLDILYNPFYWEDIDLSYRALKSGYEIAFEPKSIVVHEHEIGSIKKKYSEREVKTIAYRNQFIFVWKNLTDQDLQFLHLFWLPYHFLKALIRMDLIFFVGFCLAFLRLPQVMRERNRVQKYFMKSDKEIVREFAQ